MVVNQWSFENNVIKLLHGCNAVVVLVQYAQTEFNGEFNLAFFFLAITPTNISTL